MRCRIRGAIRNKVEVGEHCGITFGASAGASASLTPTGTQVCGSQGCVGSPVPLVNGPSVPPAAAAVTPSQLNVSATITPTGDRLRPNDLFAQICWKQAMFLKIKKIVGVSAAVVLIMAIFSWGILENTYVSYPRFPDPQDGRIVPHTVKGVIVYITQSQCDLLFWLGWIGIGSGVIAALVILIHRGDPFKSKE
jgi:hypothetical protein